MEASDADRRAAAATRWPLLLSFVAVLAGLVAAAAAVGGAMVWARLDELGLPAGRLLTIVPADDLITVGLNALAVPLLLALGAVLAVMAFCPIDKETGEPRKELLATMFALLVIVVIWAIPALGFRLIPEVLLMICAVVGAAGAIYATARRSHGRRPVAWVAFIAFTTIGAIVAVAAELSDPELEPVALLVEDNPAGIAGFMVADTADHVYLSPVSGTPLASAIDPGADRVVGVPRRIITRIAVSAPDDLGRDAGGREVARSLLASLQRQQDPGWRPEAGPALVETESPVFAFAPLVHLHSKDPSWPTTAESFVASSRLLWVHGECRAHVVALGSELAGADDPAKLDPTRLAGPLAYRHPSADRDCRHSDRPPSSAGEHTRPTDRDGRPAGLSSDEGFALDLEDRARHPRLERRTVDGQAVATGVPVYWERQERGSTQRITYWFFYALSQPPGPEGVTPQLVHEGDWERISVLLRVVEPGKYAPISVRYHFHNESGDIPWPQVPTVSAAQGLATHPVVFSARGSHASYARQGRHPQLFRGGGRNILTVQDEAIRCEECPQWRTWELLVDARAQPWYGFGGAWGQVGGLGGAGPLGPSEYKLQALEEVEAPVDGTEPAALPATAP